MDLSLDVLIFILLTLKINDIESLSLVNKLFNSLCSEKNLWLENFKVKNIEIIDKASQCINGYKKISKISYTTDCLLGMFNNGEQLIYRSMCFTDNPISIKNLENILTKDHPILTKIKKYNFVDKFIDIFIDINNKRVIYDLYENDGRKKLNLFTETYCNKELMRSLIVKILYYSSINFTDVDCIPLIILENSIFNNNELNYYMKRINYRRKYWHECYSKYSLV